MKTRYENGLVDTLPEARDRAFVYSTWEDLPEPVTGDYVVSIGNNTQRCNSVYLITSSRAVKIKNPEPGEAKFALTLVKCPDLLHSAKYYPESQQVFVGDTEAHTCFWKSRDKKK